MVTDPNVQAVQAVYEAFATRDAEAMIRHIHPECEFRPFGTRLLRGEDDPYRGHDGIRRYLADVAELWDELTLEPLDYRSAGTSVVVFGHVTGRSPRAEVDTQVTWVWKLRDALAIDIRVFPTSGEALRWLDESAPGDTPARD